MSAVTIESVARSSFAPTLQSLAAILDKASAFADSSGADLVNARLAPDMYTLAQQVQIACYFPVDAFERLTGGTAPTSMGEPETSIAGFKAQISGTLERIAAVPAAAFEGAEERDCSIDIPGGGNVIAMNGSQYLLRWALPHFYFHAVTAYDILRHAGLGIGKQDYLSSLAGFIRPKG